MAKRVFAGVEDRAPGSTMSSGSTLWDVPKGIKPAHRVQAEESRIVPVDHEIDASHSILHLDRIGILVEPEPQVIGGGRRGRGRDRRARGKAEHGLGRTTGKFRVGCCRSRR